MKASLIVLVIAAPVLAAALGTYTGKTLAASSSDARWSEQVAEIVYYCRWLQADVTETECLILLGAAI